MKPPDVRIPRQHSSFQIRFIYPTKTHLPLPASKKDRQLIRGATARIKQSFNIQKSFWEIFTGEISVRSGGELANERMNGPRTFLAPKSRFSNWGRRLAGVNIKRDARDIKKNMFFKDRLGSPQKFFSLVRGGGGKLNIDPI